ncbi:hypothetical protein ACOME3_003766 [Neoechinorhynchus agilis]
MRDCRPHGGYRYRYNPRNSSFHNQRPSGDWNRNQKFPDSRRGDGFHNRGQFRLNRWDHLRSFRNFRQNDRSGSEESTTISTAPTENDFFDDEPIIRGSHGVTATNKPLPFSSRFNDEATLNLAEKWKDRFANNGDTNQTAQTNEDYVDTEMASISQYETPLGTDLLTSSQAPLPPPLTFNHQNPFIATPAEFQSAFGNVLYPVGPAMWNNPMVDQTAQIQYPILFPAPISFPNIPLPHTYSQATGIVPPNAYNEESLGEPTSELERRDRT